MSRITLDRTLNIGTVLMFSGILISGATAWATLQSEVEHKADDSDVRVLETRVGAVEQDIAEIKNGIKEILRRME